MNAYPVGLSILFSILAIQVEDGELKHCREGYPKEIRDVGDRDPPVLRPYLHHRPDERAQDKHDIQGCKRKAHESELYRREDEVEDEVGKERKDVSEINLPFPPFVGDIAEGYEDDGIQHRPHRTEEPRRRRPIRFDVLCILRIACCCVHMTSISPITALAYGVEQFRIKV